MNKKITALIKISRPLNLLIIFITVIVAGFICSKNNNEITFKTIIAAVSASFIAAGGYIINDYFDIKIDKINRPERPLASGSLDFKFAITSYFILTFIGLAISLLINFTAFIIAICTVTLLFSYSYKFKSILLLGNFSIASLTGLTFIYGGISVNNISFAIIPAMFALLINFIREIVKDMEDVDGDIKNSVMTFPLRFGFSPAKNFILFLTIILILFTCCPFIFNLYKIEYFIIVMSIVNPILVFFLVSIYKNDSTTSLHKLSFILKLNMILGLSAIYLGK
jgi:geranylgeranylglycerol-phosphate geranylgeranyltransferase